MEDFENKNLDIISSNSVQIDVPIDGEEEEDEMVFIYDKRSVQLAVLKKN